MAIAKDLRKEYRMNVGTNTTVLGAGFGAALGAIIVYVIELAAGVDIPSPIEGAIVVVVTGILAYVVPPNAAEPGGPPSRS